MLRVLASAGTTLTLMNHQLQALIGAVSQTEQDLLRLRSEMPKKLYDRYDDITAQVSEWYEMVKFQVSQLGFLLAPDSRQRRRRHALYEVVENVRSPMSYYMKKYGVTFENNVPRNLRTPPVYQSELYSVLINILSNALKFVFDQPKRHVAVEAKKFNNTLFLRMMDTGVGVPAERREISFKPFVTTSVPNPVLGVGTGLGLKVVKDILELYGGTARFIDPKKPWKTCIEILLPERGIADDNQSTFHR
jgi:signal transduction histidine kinase